MTADSLDRERLVKLCGMFGSDHPGERANAAAAADRLVRQTGLRWPHVIQPALPPPQCEREIGSVADAIQYALENAELLTDWEVAFLRSLRRQRKPASDKQKTIVEQIVEKCRSAA